MAVEYVISFDVFFEAEDAETARSIRETITDNLLAADEVVDVLPGAVEVAF